MLRIPKRQRGRAACAALLLFAFFLLLWGAGEEEPAGESESLGQLPEGGIEVLLLTERNDRAWFAYSGMDSAVLLAMDAGTGKITARAELDRPLYWAALRGNLLFTWEESAGSVRLTAYSPDTLEEAFHRDLPLRMRDLLYFDCDGKGTAFAVVNGARDSLKVLDANGQSVIRAFPERIGYLSSTPEGVLCVAAGSALYLSQGEAFREVPCLAPPLVLLGEDLLLDADGVVGRLTETGIDALFQCPSPLLSSFFYSLDRKNRLILSNGAEKVLRYELDGSPAGASALEGRTLALCGSGAVVQRDQELCYVPFEPVQESPAPEPSPSPTPELPDFSGEVHPEGDLLIVPAGTTAAQLRKLFEPEAVKIQRPDGEAVLSGRLATGMTAGSYTLAVPGDCDGSGTITGADVREAHSMMLDRSAWARAYRRAADLDGDGVVGAGDLVLLSALALA